MQRSRNWVVAATAAVGWAIVAGLPLTFFGSGGVVVEGPAGVPAPGVLLVQNHWIPLLAVQPPREFNDCLVQRVQVQCTLTTQARLAELVANQTVRCEIPHYAKDNRGWGTCWVRGADGAYPADSLNLVMIRDGLAMVDPLHTRAFDAEGDRARRDKRGIWAGTVMPHSNQTGSLTGGAQVENAGLIEIRDVSVHLYGVDAPLEEQRCLLNGLDYACGLLARAHLMELIAGQNQVCRTERNKDDGNIYGLCGQAGPGGRDMADGATSLNEMMIEDGWAVAARGAPRDYVRLEAAARGNKRGMWAGQFVRPAEWRHGQR